MMIFLFLIAIIIPSALILLYFGSYLRYVLFYTPKNKTFVNTPVSIIIAGYNEDKYIRDKVVSFLDENEWIVGSELFVISTGSTDKTAEILKEFENDPRVHIIISEKRITKIEAVNRAVLMAANEIMVFSDCRQKMKPGSVKELVANFSDTSVGTVGSKLEDSPFKSSFFRRVINKLSIWNSGTGSCLTIYGALYAQRRSCFREFPSNILFDDLYVVVSTLVQDKRIIMEPNAIIYDLNFKSYYKRERLERLIRGLLVFWLVEYDLIRQMKGFTFIRFVIFKYLKIFLPFSFLIIGCLLIVLMVKMSSFYFVGFLGIIVLFLIIPRLRNITLLVTRINLFFALALLKFIVLNKRSIEWEKIKIE